MPRLTSFQVSAQPQNDSPNMSGGEIGDVRVKLKGINKATRKRADGTVAIYYYHRPSGKPIIGAPGTPEFIASFADAEGNMAARMRTSRNFDASFAGLVQRFEVSPEYDKMRASTRQEYRRKFRTIDKEWGDCPIAGLLHKNFRRDVLVWRDKIAHKTPREADNLVSAMSRVLSYAVDRGEIERNALLGVRRVYRANRADKIWMLGHIDAFNRAAPAELRAALTLAIHTGQRQADLLTLPWSAYDGHRIALRQAKTGRMVSIKCAGPLKAMLDTLPKRGPLILTTPSGLPWKKRYFSQRWDDACSKAGISDLHFHDLRGTAITRLAEAGASVPEIAAVTGHNLATANHILDVYLSRTQELADAAIIKFDAHASRLQK